MDYLYLGTKHMITGYDHILFLIGVIFLIKIYDHLSTLFKIKLFSM